MRGVEACPQYVSDTAIVLRPQPTRCRLGRCCMLYNFSASVKNLNSTRGLDINLKQNWLEFVYVARKFNLSFLKLTWRRPASTSEKKSRFSTFSRASFICGTDSPVSMDSSTIQGPRRSRRSQGTRLSFCERPMLTMSPATRLELQLTIYISD